MAGQSIKDRGVITDHIADWVYRNCPSWTVDTLLCRPIDAMQMSLDVAFMVGRIKPAAAKKIASAIKQMKSLETEMDVLDEICRTALASRKRGEFRRGTR